VPALQMAIVNAGGPWSVGSALIAN
jgi:hypothetical protein